MASVNVAQASGPRREYVAIQNFNNDFFSYSTATNFTGGLYQTTGTLSLVSGANSGNCPYGRILRENGKKLYPGANPGVEIYMVGVYDSVTFLNGFINPNSPVFQPMNTDKPTYMDDGVDAGSYNGTSNIGPGVYTAGAIVSTGPDGYIGLGPCVNGPTGPYGEMYYNGDKIAVEAGSCDEPYSHAGLNSDGTISATSTITTASSINAYGLFLAPGVGPAGQQVGPTHGTFRFNNTGATGGTAPGQVSKPDFSQVGFKKQTISTSAVTENSAIFLQYRGQAYAGFCSVENVNGGNSFIVISNNVQDCNPISYLIVN
jgi:hypothetical protein